MEENTKTRYSDEELEEFRGIINEMLDKARAEYATLRKVIMNAGGNDILVTENTTCPDPCPVGPVVAVFKDIIQQINILLHELLYIGRPKTLILTKFLQR